MRPEGLEEPSIPGGLAQDCPHCGADLRGEPVPPELAERYPSGTFRTVGNVIRGVYDGVLFWSCPDCSRAWPRSFSSARLQEASKAYARRFTAEAAEG